MKRLLHKPAFFLAVCTITLIVIYFRKFLFHGLLPIPLDIIGGIYYPWRDYNWGYAVAVPVKNPLPSDIVSFIYPFRILAIDMLKGGNWPLWNPYILSGTPLLANFQTAIFYPTTLLYFIFHSPIAWSISILLQPLFSLIFMFLFLYNIFKKYIPAFFGAAVFSFNAFATVWLAYNTHGHTAYWLPLELFIIDKFIETRKLFLIFLLVISFALQLFSGYPQIMLYSLGIVLVWVIYRFNTIPKKVRKFTYILLFLSLIGGLLLSAIQLFPAAEFLNRSNRFVDTTILAANGGFLPIKQLITLLIPDFFGNPVTINYWGAGFYDNFAGYAGITTVVLSIFSVFSKYKKLTTLLLLLFVVSILLSIRSPLSLVLANFNILGFKAAVPSRALFVTAFSLAMLGAIGLDWLIEEKDKKIPLQKVLRPTFYIGAIIAGVLLPIILTMLLLKMNCLHIFAVCDTTYTHFFITLKNSLLPLLLFGGTALTLVAFYYLLKWRQAITVIFILLLVADLFRFGNKYLTFAPQTLLYPQTSVITFVKEHASLTRVSGGDSIPMNFWEPYGLYAASGYDAQYGLRYAQFQSILRGGDGELALGRYGEVIDYHKQLFDLLGIKYIFAQKYTPEKEIRPYGEIQDKFKIPKFKQIFDDKSVAVLENTQSFDRAFLVDRYVVAENNREIAKLMQDETINLHKVIVLEQQPKLQYTDASGSASIMQYEPNKVAIQTQTTGNMLLFLSDTHEPNWHVTIDGQNTNLLRADFAFRAVEVPQGAHTIIFSYLPQSFVIGGFVSVLSAIVIIGCLLMVLLKKRQA